ncbi:MAG: M48 family metalloprotease [Nitrospinaceae bacterium]|nr:M48 family metallopeptidase [Nitrospinaceae bacterium]NIR55865.1 M48 family metallopeptidase [Nitrospinaceae bacterium]NIS86318.1 M48 family metallopeptidase [Nitrospinaceae bacterium]NIT83148.1 M48 family metallopeptidase [Nitrospinaceae bacterium]NIU45357.1 M48 family metallopeptidase [Nitrospinaceae bacterium]
MNTTQFEFTGFYFDGHSANKYSLTVRLTPRELVLVFPDKQTYHWPYSTLHLSQTGSAGPIRLEKKTSDPDRIPESVVIEDLTFMDAAHQVAPGALGSVWNRPHQRSLRVWLVVLMLILIPPFLFVTWKYGIPTLTDAVAERVPVEWEEKLGNNFFKTLFVKPLKEPDRQTRKALDAISKRLLSSVPDQPYHFRIYVHPSGMVNALALPGGTIVVFQGLINATNTPEELAGVLAHEFQHVLHRHSTRGIVRQMAAGMLLSIVVGDSNTVLTTILETAGTLDSLRFSRDLESQADSEGMKMILASRVDPRGMVKVFETLKREESRHLGKKKKDSKDKNVPEKKPDEKDSAEEGGLPEWMKYLSTHPAGKDRVALLKEMAAASQVKPEPLLPGFDWKSLHKKVKKGELPF